MAVGVKKSTSLNTNLTLTMSRWIAWTLFVLGGVCFAEDTGFPKIIPDKDIIRMKIGETLELSCRGDEPITWNYTRVNENDTDRVTIEHGEDSSEKSRYWAKFTMKYLTFADTQYYECRYNSSSVTYDEYEEDTRNSHIYVMVEDLNNLLVNPEHKSWEFLPFATAGVSYTIPCKPTSDKVHIEISKGGSFIELNERNYDKRDGLRITPVLMSSGNYQCTGKLGNVTNEIIYHLIVNSNDSLNKPKINTTGGSVAVGGTFTLDCIIPHKPTVHYTLNWTKPVSVINSGRAEILNAWVGEKQNAYQSRLTITDARKEDAGEYECTVKGTGNAKVSVIRTIRIYEEEERFLNVTTLAEEIKVREHETAKWVINISSYPPKPNYIWVRDGKEIQMDNYFKIDETESEIILQKRSSNLDDAGSYQFVADLPKFPNLKRVLNLSLVVTSPPDVHIDPRKEDKYFEVNTTNELTCEAVGFPIPTIQWYFQSCPNFENRDQNCLPRIPVPDNKMGSLEKGHQKSVRKITFTANEHGIYWCFASNILQQDVNESHHVQVVDFPGQKGYGITAPKRFIEGDSVNLTCGASKLDFNESKIIWQQKLSPNSSWVTLTSNPPNVIVGDMDTQWSWKKYVQIEDISTNYSGDYRCVVDKDKIISEVLRVDKTKVPKIENTNLNGSTLTIKEGEYPQYQLFCYADGVPEPSIIWFRNGEPAEQWPPEIKYSISNDSTTVTFNYIREVATGEYRCESRSRAGKDEATIILEVIGTSNKMHPAMIVFLILIVIAVFVLLACLSKKMHKERRMKIEMQNLYHIEWEEGAVGDINPELGVEDQASLLPYDKKWEFPKDRIKLGMQLGSGAFGRVVKAEATGILKNESVTEVAVKMVKANADESHIKALMSELKIMVHLGQHVNVVNLLGACTKNLAKKRELLVIVEYCKYGSLLSYLHRHKHSFINQLDPVRDVVDSKICTQEDLSSRQSQIPKLNYASLTFADTGRKATPNGYRTLEEIGSCPVTPSTPPPPYAPPSLDYNPSQNSFSEGYATGGNTHSMCTDMSYVSNCPSVIDTDGKRRSSSGSCAGHYRGDYQQREVTDMTTTDLLGWSFQIARGMEYLASRKVLHGDLAARNVLLAENNVVKICDFGLAKEMYKDYKYKKKSEGVLLPVKWMAIESIYFAEFSTQSDAWSFGVVLWEVFTLGKTPYPGMEADDRFYKMLNDGYRMEKPPLAPSSIYDLMMNCWSHEPSSRPTFTALADRIGDLMEESLRQHYIDLNVSFDKNNKLRLQSNPDYLAKMGGPEFKVNDEPAAEPMYANVPDTLGSDYMFPSHQQTSNSGYQNVQVDMENVEGARLQPLAENAGYMFVNHLSPANEDIPICSTFVKAGMANNDGYSLTHFPPSSPGPRDVFSPRPASNKAGLEFNFTDKNITRNSEEVKTASSSLKNVLGHSPSVSPPKEVSGISNVNYIPNNTIFPQNMKELNEVLLDISEKSTSPKRQKNDSGVSSIGSNFENKSPTPPICSNSDTNCNSDMLQNRNSFILHHENVNQRGIDV